MILNTKEFTTPFEEISPQELNKCLQKKFYLSARKSDDRGRSVIARQNVIAGNSKWVKNHIFVLSDLNVLVYILLAEYITIIHLSVGGFGDNYSRWQLFTSVSVASRPR